MTIHTHTFDFADYASTARMNALSELSAETGFGRLEGYFSADRLGLESTANLCSVVAVILKNGDLSTTERVREAHKACTDLTLPAARSVKPVWVERNLTGRRVDIGAALRGEARCWGRFERTRQANGARVVALYVPMGGLASRSAEEIGWATVAGIVVADILEGAGYRAEVWGCSQADQHTGDSLSVRTLLKGADVPMDIHAVSRIAHPAVFRALVLGIRGTHFGQIGRKGGKCSESFGSTEAIDPRAFGDEGAIAVRHSYSIGEAVGEIERVIAEFQ